MAAICDRLREAMTLRMMRQVDLVEKTGITKGAVSAYVKGSFEPKAGNLYLLARALDVNEAWLMGLDAPMCRAEDNYNCSEVEANKNNMKFYTAVSKFSTNSELKNLFDISSELSSEDLKTLIEMAKWLQSKAEK